MSRFASQENPRTSIALTVIFLILSILLLSISDRTSLNKPKMAGITLASFFQNGLHESGQLVSRTFASFAELKRISSAYEEALNQIEAYQGIERNLEQLEDENRRLKNILDFSESISFKNIPVEVIARDPENIFSSILINKGSRDGISKGMAVVASQNGMIGLVGRVTDIGLNSSIVMPITDNSSFVAARLQDDRYEGLIRGSGINNSSLQMTYVSQKALPDIKKEELVVTSGMNSIFPSDIIIGRVIEIHSKEFATSLTLDVYPVVDFDRLEYLLVLKEDTDD